MISKTNEETQKATNVSDRVVAMAVWLWWLWLWFLFVCLNKEGEKNRQHIFRFA